MKRGSKRVLSAMGFLLSLYFFMFALTLIKFSSQALGSGFLNLTRDGISSVNAFGLGWLATLITQSSGAAAATLIVFSLAGFIGPVVLIYMMMGTRIGTSITALFVAFLVHAKRRDFRHGFEVGLANLVYAVPIAVLMFLLEFFTDFFSRFGEKFSVFGLPTVDIVDMITSPLVGVLSFLPHHLNTILGVFVLIASLKYLPRFMIGIWREAYLKKKINQFLDKKWKSFFLGLGITTVLMSTSITITFLIPLVVTRLTSLRKVIPYMIGANLGGVSELVIGGFVLGAGALPAIFTYVSFSAIGLLWMVNPDLLWKATKFLSKRTLHVSRARALVFIVIFVLMAVVLSFV